MKKVRLLCAVMLAFASLCGCAKPLTTPMPTLTASNAPQVAAATPAQTVENADVTPSPRTPASWINPGGATIASRFILPEGFRRVDVKDRSFEQYLRNLPLKEDGASVLCYDGNEKPKGVYAAVVDMPISERDLQQCADAIIRLRAEYLYAQGKYHEIAFHFTSGFLCEYEKWRKGYRVKVDGNECSYVSSAVPDDSYATFRKYLELVFVYAGTRSLEKELQPVEDISDMRIGDVFVKGGSPGHAVIVVDMIENVQTGEKKFLLAQSYMPAQETQVLYYQGSEVWYPLDFGDVLQTPEWTFEASQLRRFE